MAHYEKEGPVDEAARHAMDAERFKEAGNVAEAAKSYQQASAAYMVAMNAAKQSRTNDTDQLAIETLQALGNDYRRRAKLLDFRQKASIQIMTDRLQKMKEESEKR